jgi:hypothetical protein
LIAHCPNLKFLAFGTGFAEIETARVLNSTLLHCSQLSDVYIAETQWPNQVLKFEKGYGLMTLWDLILSPVEMYPYDPIGDIVLDQKKMHAVNMESYKKFAKHQWFRPHLAK